MSAPERTEAEMAERIAAFEAAPAAAESWTGSQVAVDLRRAADVLERDGWTQGGFTDEAGRRCADGAIVVACGGNNSRLSVLPDNRPRRDAAENHLADHIGRPFGSGSSQFEIQAWNDLRALNADEVIAALRAAADKADQP